MVIERSDSWEFVAEEIAGDDKCAQAFRRTARALFDSRAALLRRRRHAVSMAPRQCVRIQQVSSI